jgi:DNA invertase Pin-like site-specific DNA recombinase
MRAFFSEMERRQISHRTKKAMEFKKAEGKVIGNVPYGYQREGKNLIPNDSEQAVLEIANAMYAEGERLKDIVMAVNNSGMRNRNGSEWTASQIRNIIDNYQGKFCKSKTKTTSVIRRLIETI